MNGICNTEKMKINEPKITSIYRDITEFLYKLCFFIAIFLWVLGFVGIIYLNLLWIVLLVLTPLICESILISICIVEEKFKNRRGHDDDFS